MIMDSAAIEQLCFKNLPILFISALSENVHGSVN